MSEGTTAFELCSRVLILTGGDAAPLIALAKGRETGWLEFKATCEPPEDGQDSGTNADDYRWHVARAVIAMANTDGGCLLLGVDDAGGAVGLEHSDRKGKIQSEGMDSFIRHLNQTVFHPKNGWRCEKSGNIEIDDGVPPDLVEPVSCQLDGVQILAVLVKPREKPLHCKQRERFILLVKHLGDVGEVIEITRPRKIEEWEERRQPSQPVYADILRRFEMEGNEPSQLPRKRPWVALPLWVWGAVAVLVIASLGICRWPHPPVVHDSLMWKDIIAAQDCFSISQRTQWFSIRVGNDEVRFKVTLHDRPAAYQVVAAPATPAIYMLKAKLPSQEVPFFARIGVVNLRQSAI